MSPQILLQSVGELGARIMDGIMNIEAERDQENHASSNLPHLLLHELVKMSTSDFGKAVVDVHLQQLQYSYNEECIVGIECELRELALKSMIEEYTRVEIKSFETE